MKTDIPLAVYPKDSVGWFDFNAFELSENTRWKLIPFYKSDNGIINLVIEFKIESVGVGGINIH